MDPLCYFSFQPVLHDWCNKACGMCYPVCGMVHIKEPLLFPITCRYSTISLSPSWYSSKGTCCFELRVASFESLAPRKIVTAAMTSASSSEMSWGRRYLHQRTLYPEKPRFITSHFLKKKRQKKLLFSTLFERF